MKRAVLLSILLAILFLPKSNAQHFSFVTSFGVTQSWGIPYEVVHAIEHDYWGYDVVHTSRINQHGKLFFDVLLQRGDVFVNVSIGRYGRIYNRVITYDYPFYNHVCNNFCGYHSNFYRRNVVACGSHHHHGHNHVTYDVRHHNYYSHPGNGNAYAYGHYKAKSNKHYDTHQNNRKDYRDTNSYKSRMNSNDYQSRSSSRYVVENSKNRGNNDAYRSNSSNSTGGGNGRSYNSRSSSKSDNAKTSTKSTTRSTASSSNGRSYSGSSGRTRAN